MSRCKKALDNKKIQSSKEIYSFKSNAQLEDALHKTTKSLSSVRESLSQSCCNLNVEGVQRNTKKKRRKSKEIRF